MEQRFVHKTTMLKGISRFILENTITPPIALVTELKAEVDTTIAALEAAAAAQFSGSGEASGGAGTRDEMRTALRSYLKDVARVGRSLDEATHPGLAEIFVLPKSRSYTATLAAAQVMIAKATELEAVFVAHGLPATFLANLQGLVTGLTGGTNSKIDGRQTQVGGTAEVKYRASLGMEAANKLDAIIRAHFRDDPVKLAVWAHARHVQNAPEGEEEPETPPDSGSGSGTTVVVSAGAATTTEGGSVA